MATAKTWLWIIVGFIGICVLGLVVIAGAGIYFVSHHISVRSTSSPQALRSLDATRARFNATPLIEIDPFDHPREIRDTADLPTSSLTPTDLYVLAWNPDEEKLARVSVPLWVLRLGRHRIEILKSSRGFNLESLNLDIAELERIGPALVLDYRNPSGERVLIWTQ
jgi:hypothetical protein